MNKTVLLFPGQGSQFIGMGKSICTRYPAADKLFEEASDVLGFDLKKLCFEGDQDVLTRTENTQPALLTASVAAFRIYMEETGEAPAYAAGHSLGEISALTCTGAVSFPDAVRIVRRRGQLMQEAAGEGTGGMAAVTGLDSQIVAEQCDKFSTGESTIVVSNYNSKDQTVISGHLKGLESISGVLAGMGARVVPLKVSAPFHSPLMGPAAESFREELSRYTFNRFAWPVVSNVTALPYTSPESIVENLVIQMSSPVKWLDSMLFLEKQGVGLAVELGGRSVLKNLMPKCAGSIRAVSFSEGEDVEKLRQMIAQMKEEVVADKTGFTPTLVTKCIAAAVCTRNRNWNNDEYRKGVIEPYRRIQKLQSELESGNRQPTVEQMSEVLEMLRMIFATKKVPLEEQKERFCRIFDETGTGNHFQDFNIKSI